MGNKVDMQINCLHSKIEEDSYSGHDSHYDYYETKCNDCDAVFDDYKH